VAATAVLGCSFRAQGPSSAPADAAAPDAPDAAIPFAPCVAAPTSAPAVVAALGGDGGDPRPALACAADELPIGIAFDVSQDPISDHADQHAMVNVRVRCARVSRTPAGTFTLMPGVQLSSTGGMGGNCSDYFPIVPSVEATCQAGTVLVGITGNRADDTLYNTVALICAALAVDGTPTALTTTHPVTGTGTYTNQPQTARCAASQVIASFGIRSGCGQDQLSVACAPVGCQ
jgi:hypothetical protein